MNRRSHRDSSTVEAPNPGGPRSRRPRVTMQPAQARTGRAIGPRRDRGSQPPLPQRHRGPVRRLAPHSARGGRRDRGRERIRQDDPRQAPRRPPPTDGGTSAAGRRADGRDPCRPPRGDSRLRVPGPRRPAVRAVRGTRGGLRPAPSRAIAGRYLRARGGRPRDDRADRRPRREPVRPGSLATQAGDAGRCPCDGSGDPRPG